MASQQLRNRSNWQTLSGQRALGVEKLFCIGLQQALDSVYPNQFQVDSHPTDFASIYSNFDLSEETLNEIYNPDLSNKRWGIKMDFAIRNNITGKTLYGEIKRQDGWIENTKPSAGRGNAHERSAKYFTPGLQRVLREKSKIQSETILPF